MVGPQGIGPCLPVPKTGVLPVYDGPVFLVYAIGSQTTHIRYTKSEDKATQQSVIEPRIVSMV